MLALQTKGSRGKMLGMLVKEKQKWNKNKASFNCYPMCNHPYVNVTQEPLHFTVTSIFFSWPHSRTGIIMAVADLLQGCSKSLELVTMLTSSNHNMARSPTVKLHTSLIMQCAADMDNINSLKKLIIVEQSWQAMIVVL